MKLGQKAKDKVTGFSGRITGRTTYLTGCDQYLIQPTAKSEGEFQDARWFDEQRLSVFDETDVLTLENQRAGADVAAPIKQE